MLQHRYKEIAAQLKADREIEEGEITMMETMVQTESVQARSDQPSPAVGLDVGTSRIVVAQRAGQSDHVRIAAQRLRHHSAFENHANRV